MTYKSGIKTYLFMGVAYGIVMGLFFGMFYKGVVLGIISGIACAVLFTLGMFIFVKAQEKTFVKMRAEIASERKIICDGEATLRGNGGWMFFTEYGLEFYPHKLNFSREQLKIPMETVKSVTAIRKELQINAIGGMTHTLTVANNIAWKKHIDEYLKLREKKQEQTGEAE